MFLSLYVRLPEDITIKRNLTYFVWEYGKAPDLAIEIVSNRKGGELSYKLADYIRVGVPFYVVYDPMKKWKQGTLLCFERQGGSFVPRDGTWFDSVGLGLTLWEGTFEDAHATWLRWCDKEGHLIPTGAELAQRERTRAEEERTRAEEATTRAERLLAQLRAAGIEPDA
jgi:hypothetical protein